MSLYDFYLISTSLNQNFKKQNQNLLTSIPSEISVLPYSSIFICLIHIKYHLNKINKIRNNSNIDCKKY